MTCLSTKFEVATSNGLGGDIFKRNAMDTHTHRRTDRQRDRGTMDKLWYEINIPFFSNEMSEYYSV